MDLLNSLLDKIDEGKKRTSSSVVLGGDGETLSKRLKNDGDSAASISKSLVVEWTALFDPSTNLFYYYNIKTQETTWSKPGGFVDDPIIPYYPVSSTSLSSASDSFSLSTQQAYFGKHNDGSFAGMTDHFASKGIASDKAGRQLSHFCDLQQLENREIKPVDNKDWKKRKEIKNKKKNDKKLQWLKEDD